MFTVHLQSPEQPAAAAPPTTSGSAAVAQADSSSEADPGPLQNVHGPTL